MTYPDQATRCSALSDAAWFFPAVRSWQGSPHPALAAPRAPWHVWQCRLLETRSVERRMNLPNEFTNLTAVNGLHDCYHSCRRCRSRLVQFGQMPRGASAALRQGRDGDPQCICRFGRRMTRAPIHTWLITRFIDTVTIIGNFVAGVGAARLARSLARARLWQSC